MTKKRNWSAEGKIGIVLSGIKGDKFIAQIKNSFKVLFKNVQSLAGELQGAESKDSKDELLEKLITR